MTDPLAKPATKYTKDANANAAALINFDDDGDFRRAQPVSYTHLTLPTKCSV